MSAEVRTLYEDIASIPVVVDLFISVHPDGTMLETVVEKSKRIPKSPACVDVGKDIVVADETELAKNIAEVNLFLLNSVVDLKFQIPFASTYENVVAEFSKNSLLEEEDFRSFQF
jgi:hypothetical protein